MAVEKLSEVANPAMSKFDRFGGGIKATLSFVQGTEGQPHGLLDRSGIGCKHDGSQPKGREILFQNA